MRTSPLVGSSRLPAIVSSVDFPEPRRAHHRDEVALVDREVDVVEGMDLGRALAVGLRDVVEFEQAHLRRPSFAGSPASQLGRSPEYILQYPTDASYGCQERRSSRVELPVETDGATGGGSARGARRASDSGLGGGTVWSTIRPSRMKTTRSAHDASCASWVTTTAATPRLAGGEDHAHHRLAVRRVERARGLVGEQQTTARRRRPRDRDPLALATGELVGVVRRPDRRARALRAPPCRRDAPSSPRAPSSSSGSETFSDGGEPGEEIEVLEDVADRPTTKSRLVVARHRRQRRRRRSRPRRSSAPRDCRRS